MRRHFHSNLPVLFPCVFDGSLSRSFFRSRISIEWDEARYNHEAYQSVIHCFSIFPRYIRKPLYIVTLTRIFTLIPTFPSHLASSHKKTPGLTLIVTINTTFGPLFAWQKIFFSLYIFPLSRISSTIFKREREETHVFVNDACPICPLTRRYLSLANVIAFLDTRHANPKWFV